MSIKAFIPQMWASRLLEPFFKALVFADLCNRDYEGEIKQLGDTVKISGVGPVSVTAYGGSVTYQTLESEQQMLKITERDYFGFQVDDADAAQSGVTFMSSAMRNSAYALKDTVDSFIAAFYADAGSTTQQVAVNSLNIVAVILSLGQTMDELNIPREGRWLVLPPWLITKLIIAKILVENSTNDAFTNGTVGRALGFDIRMSNNVKLVNGVYYPMAGTRDAISFAGDIDPQKIEALRDKDAFNDYIRGEILFGAKVIQPDALVTLACTVAVEP